MECTDLKEKADAHWKRCSSRILEIRHTEIGGSVAHERRCSYFAAIQVNWSDGHSTGIYSFESLRAFAERGAARVVEDV